MMEVYMAPVMLNSIFVDRLQGIRFKTCLSIQSTVKQYSLQLPLKWKGHGVRDGS